MSDTSLPNHVGIILDGNRRWAKQNGVSTLEAHRLGAENFKLIAKQAFDSGIPYVTGFVFSTENWSRSETEVNYFMKLISKAVDNYLKSFHEEGIRILVVGRRNGLRRKVVNAIKASEEQTKNNTRGTLALCLNYGGQEEIVDAAKIIVASGTRPEDITTKTIESALYNPDIPPLDLMIRTSGEERTSGFMMYRAAYAELYFSNKYWPEFTPADLEDAIENYQNRQRRFGA